MHHLTKRYDDPPRLSDASIGRATSPDLMHWGDQPLALTPGPLAEVDLFGRTGYDCREGPIGPFVEDGELVFRQLDAFALALA